MSKNILFHILILVISLSVAAQQNKRLSWHTYNTKDTLLNSISFRNVGPTIMSGRVTDIEVDPQQPTHFYVAYASGGVWVTYNNGQTFSPIFDHNASITIGDMAVDWHNHTLYVGTGEVNSSRSSYAGTGMYKSNDTGKTWQYLGLPESHHIGKIILNNNNPNDIQVAVLGHLYTYNRERGMYKSNDGGQTWQQTLYINDSTGCVDIVRKNNSTLYCATWTRARKAWHFNGSGSGSAIYKSTDNGSTWQKITTNNNGFPQNEGVGRIGLALHDNNIYAILDNQNREPDTAAKKTSTLKALTVQKMTDDEFLNTSDNIVEKYLRDNGYPEKYNAQSIKKDIKEKKYTVKDIADWVLSDADVALFQTPIIGAELYISDNDGETWHKTHSEKLEGVVFTYGYYFGTIAVDPNNAKTIYIAGYPILKSNDGGNTFTAIDGNNCHPDYHRIWINPNNSQHIITGNDGGINMSYDAGQNWIKCNNPAVGQFYAIELDDAKPYNIYGGLQDNGTWVGSSNYAEDTGWHQEGTYNYKSINGGDGMQVRVDTRDNNTVYTGYQFGYYNRSTKNGNSDYVDIHPTHSIGEKPFRFNWQTPIWLSKHNQDILYYGSNYFHRSLNKGERLEKLGQDLTTTTYKGNVPYGTLTTIHESPIRFGLLYCGTDDGNIYISKDLGYTWDKIINSLPPHLWVSRVTASQHKVERIYCSLNGYRNDDFTPYLYVSDDYGQHWQAISNGLPNEPINVIKEDPKKENIIYVGTDNGLYVSFDTGKNFMPWMGNLPRVAIHDIAIHTRENEIILGTHGRSIYIASLNTIQLFDSIKNSNQYISPIEAIVFNPNWGKKNAIYDTPNLPQASIHFYTALPKTITLQILNPKGKTILTKQEKCIAGFNTITLPLYTTIAGKDFTLQNNIWCLNKGMYTISILENGTTLASTPLSIVEKKK